MKLKKITALLALISVCLCGCALRPAGTNQKILSAGGINGEYSFGSGELTDKVERIEIEWASGKLNLAQHDGNAICIEERCGAELPEEQKVHWRVDGTTLHIWFSKPNTFDLINLNSGKKELTVTLPESLRLDALEIDAASAGISGTANAGKLRVDTASGPVTVTTDAEDVAVDTASGSVRLNHSGEAKRVELNTASGEILAELGNIAELDADSASGKLAFTARSLGTAEISSASGDVHLTCDSTPTELEIDTASGAVTLTLPGDADFRMEVDTASGKFRSEIPLAMQDDEYLAGSGRGEIEISTASGDITLKSGS